MIHGQFWNLEQRYPLPLHSGAEVAAGIAEGLLRDEQPERHSLRSLVLAVRRQRLRYVYILQDWVPHAVR